MPEQPTNEWERAYEESVRREQELVEATPGYAFTMFGLGLRGLILGAGLAAIAVAFTGRAVGVGGMGPFWVAFGIFLVLGSLIWWRRWQRDRC